MPSAHRGSEIPCLADDDFLSKAFMPTIEVTLSALELEFDKQLDSMLGDEFASLADLEPIATTSVPLSLAAPDKIPCGPVSLLEGRSPNTTADSLSGALSTMGFSADGYKAKDNVSHTYNTVNTGETITRTTSAPHNSTSVFSHSNAKPPKSGGIDFVSTCADITRSTKMAAPLPLSTQRSEGPTVRKTHEPRIETVTRSTTNAASLSSRLHGSLMSAEPALPVTKEVLDGQETVTRSTNPAALQPRSDDGGTTPTRTTPAISAPTAGEGALRSQTLLPHLPRAVQSGFSSHTAPYSTPACLATEASPNALTGIMNEDVDMPCSDPQQVFHGCSSQGIQNQTDALGGNLSGWQQAAPASSWTFQAPNVAFSPSACESYLSQAPASGSATYPFEPHTISYSASTPYQAHPPPALHLPHLSIFELIRPEPESHCRSSSVVSYVIQPAIVPAHIWQEEMAREQRRIFEKNVGEPARRARVSRPYFSRTPLALKKPVRRSKTNWSSSIASHTAGECDSPLKSNASRNKPYARPARRTQERPPSPTPSSLSVDSSASDSSFASTSTSASYYERKLSSPPPFEQRRRCLEGQPRGVLNSALKSMSWLWMWQG
ncbi:hypothetical protein FB451DRAFT_1366788 [Mycena latifolia]|nr:hypothetical protein FB451DRAFT_1366788 [Mycena latifolia]